MSESVLAELQRLVLRLSVMSQVPASPVGRSSRGSDDSIGGRRPGEPTGLRMMEDHQLGYPLKSPEYFQREIARAKGRRRRLEELRDEARDAVDRWQHAKVPEGQPPTIDHPQWKQWVAESPLSVKEVVRLFNVSRQYVYKIRKDYAS